MRRPSARRASCAVAGVRFDGRDWQFEQKLAVPDLDIGDGFGAELDISGQAFVAGVPSKDDEFGDNAGAAYVYNRGAAGWELEARVTAEDQAFGDGFGLSVALEGNRLLVGSTSDVGPAMAGAANLFERGPGGWAQRPKLTSPAAADFGFFGSSLALQGNRAWISDRLGNDETATAVQVFDLGPSGPQSAPELDFPVLGGGHVLENNTIANSSCMVLVGDALHGANLGVQPSYAASIGTCGQMQAKQLS